MQVASLFESAQGASSSRETQNSSNARTSSGAVDFAEILARKRETLSDATKVIESDETVVAEREESAETQSAETVASSEDGTDTTRVEQDRETDDDNDDSDTRKVDDDPDETWLAFSTERISRNPVTNAQKSTVVESSEVSGASTQNSTNVTETVDVDADLLAALQNMENDPAVLLVEESSEGFLAALKTLADTDENAAAVLKTLLKTEGQVSNQDTASTGLNPLTALANLAELTGAPDPDGDNFDLKTLMKQLVDAVSKEVSSQTDATADDQTVDSSSTRISSTQKSDAESDTRLIVGAAQNRNAVFSKAVAETTSANADSTTASSVEKVVLQSVRYLISKNEKSMTVQLSPPSLGELRIEVTSNKSSVNVSLLSNNSSVRDVLAGHAVGLREALARSGVDVTQVAVLPTLSGQATDPQYSGHTQQDFTSSNSSSWTDSSTVVESEQKSYEKSYAPTSSHGGALNLFV
jgi:flagellar hook-length control protein FliK